MIQRSEGFAPEGYTIRRRRRRWHEVWWDIARVSLHETLLRLVGHLGLMAVVGLGIWAARMGLGSLPADAATLPDVSTDAVAAAGGEQAQGEAFETSQMAWAVGSKLPNAGWAPPNGTAGLGSLPSYTAASALPTGIARAVNLHTVIPTRPRLDVIKYVVKPGDTLFGIAERFGLKPETVLWGNYEELQDDPHSLQPGQELNILPVDGTFYVWHEGDALVGVAEFFGVAPQEIIDWPGNGLSPEVDLQDPGIEPGTGLVIPRGQRGPVTWRTPRIPRSNPATARILGPGACGAVYDGVVGDGVFVWPTPGKSISGYRYNAAIHPGVDIGGKTGNAIFAADSGVVVYAGLNNYGYGNVVVLDHGNGWQTLYAHLSQVNVSCGQEVFQGSVIGAMGCTGNCSGPHLHFEMMHDQYGKVDPLNFLP